MVKWEIGVFASRFSFQRFKHDTEYKDNKNCVVNQQSSTSYTRITGNWLWYVAGKQQIMHI
jgi:hypothetical protein